MIPLVTPRRARLKFAAISVAFVLGCGFWVATTRSWTAIIFGGVGIVVMLAPWLLMYAGRRAHGDSPAEIVATKEGLSSALWSVEWSGVRRVSIGAMPYSGLRALRIETVKPSDVTWKTRSSVLRLNARLERAAKQPIQIPQVNVERPLEELVAELERLASRPLN